MKKSSYLLFLFVVMVLSCLLCGLKGCNTQTKEAINSDTTEEETVATFSGPQPIKFDDKEPITLKVGEAKVTIKGKNSLTGSVTKSFDIVPKKVSSLKLSSTSAGKMKVSWKKSTSGNCSRYEIQYWRSSDTSNKKTVKVTGYSNTSKTISGLAKGKKYVVRIRQYKNGQYSDWTSTKSITVKK